MDEKVYMFQQKRHSVGPAKGKEGLKPGRKKSKKESLVAGFGSRKSVPNYSFWN